MTYLRNSALLVIIVGFTIFAVWWSNQVELDEFARMQGVVIPSTKEKVIQSEFPGRLISTNVVVGQFVLEGELQRNERFGCCAVFSKMRVVP